MVLFAFMCVFDESVAEYLHCSLQCTADGYLDSDLRMRLGILTIFMGCDLARALARVILPH